MIRLFSDEISQWKIKFSQIIIDSLEDFPREYVWVVRGKTGNIYGVNDYPEEDFELDFKLGYNDGVLIGKDSFSGEFPKEICMNRKTFDKLKLNKCVAKYFELG